MVWPSLMTALYAVLDAGARWKMMGAPLVAFPELAVNVLVVSVSPVGQVDD